MENQTEPVTTESYVADGAAPTPWEEARLRLAQAGTYWVATVHPDSRPHLVPVLAVWANGALHFAASEITRKARNLASNAQCVVSTSHDRLDVVVEGEAEPVRDDAALRRVAEVYGSKYEWPVTVSDGAIVGDGAPTAGPPPYGVYRVRPAIAFAFPHDETFAATRWRF